MIECIPLLFNLLACQEREPLPWSRKIEQEAIVSLELASRRYVAEGKPDLWLVGVAHIADGAFYEEVSMLLDQLDVVLYESVRPTGSRPPSNANEAIALQSTKESMAFVADIGVKAAEELGEIPQTLEALIVEASLIDRRLSGWVDDASVDAWNRPFALQVHQGGTSFSLWSFGSDGAIGGEGTAADMVETRTVVFVDPFAEGTVEDVASEQTNIQAALAEALDFEFQLDALPYEEPNWFCSDLTIGEVNKKLAEKGADTALLDTITGESFTAQLSSNMMKLIPMLDSLAGGGVKETARLLMIEILSIPDAQQMSAAIDSELMEVIIVDRNSELLKDVAATIDIVENVKTIGVLYGAGHMNDLDLRLRSLFGYQPEEERWLTTMSVDPSKSLIDEKSLRRMKMMLRYQMYKAQQAKEAEEVNASE